VAGIRGLWLGRAGALAGLAATLTIGSLATASSASASRAARTSAADPGVAAATTAPTQVILNGAAALSASNAWAVGTWSQNGQVYKSLIEHWNGSKWQIKTSPSPGNDTNSLNAVAASSSTQAWAVGDYHVNGQRLRTLVEHWNGSSWKVQASPSPVAGNNTLSSVAALSRSNVWAVGYTLSTTGAMKTLIEHWNGSAWKVVKSPSPASASLLNAVTAVSRTNAWAVGYTESSDGTFDRTLVEHWNGSSWQVQSSPNPGVTSNWPCGVVATSAGDAWLTGTFIQGGTGYQEPLMEHWNGTAWQTHASAVQPSGYEFAPCAMTAASASNVWAVGGRWYLEEQHTLIEHWNGTSWKVQASPNPAPGDWDTNVLYGVSASSGSCAWAVGSSYVYNSGHRKQLIQHWNGSSWQVQYGQMP
jgi:hypothetical protein